MAIESHLRDQCQEKVDWVGVRVRVRKRLTYWVSTYGINVRKRLTRINRWLGADWVLIGR